MPFMGRAMAAGALLAGGLAGQMLDPAKLLHPTPDAWPMYNGDYSGRRFSPLAKANTANIDSLSLAWVFRIGAGESGRGDQVDAGAPQRHSLFHASGPCVGYRRARRARGVELHVAIEGRNPYRESRRGT